MVHGGKCPKCEKTMMAIQIEPVKLNQLFSNTYAGVSYQCPMCRTVLSVGPDFLLWPNDIAEAVANKLGR